MWNIVSALNKHQLQTLNSETHTNNESYIYVPEFDIFWTPICFTDGVLRSDSCSLCISSLPFVNFCLFFLLLITPNHNCFCKYLYPWADIVTLTKRIHLRDPRTQDLKKRQYQKVALRSYTSIFFYGDNQKLYMLLVVKFRKQRKDDHSLVCIEDKVTSFFGLPQEFLITFFYNSEALLGSLADRQLLQCRRPWFDFCIRKILWRRHRLPTLVFLDSPGGSAGKESTCNVGDLGLILGWEDPLEKGTATQSNVLVWRIPWTVQSMGSQRVGHG